MKKILLRCIVFLLLLSSVAFSQDVGNSNITPMSEINAKLDQVTELISKGSLDDANKIISGIPMTDYNKRLFQIRAGLLAGNREYKDAVILLNRILDDTSLTDEEKSTSTRLKDYCIEKLDTSNGESNHICKFCHAHISSKSAYCPICLQFQHSIAEIKSKKTKVKINYSESGSIQSVNSVYINKHAGKNAFGIGAVLAGAAVGGYYGGGAAMSLPMIIKSPDTIEKTFSFVYNQNVAQTLNFKADAKKGEVTTSMIALDGLGGSTSGKVARQDATRDPKSFDDYFVYSNNPAKDPIALKIAFGINLSRMFYQSANLEPFRWDEPHTFSVEYANNGKITSAVDIYRYEQNSEGKYLIANPNPAYKDLVHISFDESEIVWKFDYNTDGLLSSIMKLQNGFPIYRRTITYNSFGIDQEIEASGTSNFTETKLEIAQLRKTKDAALEKARQKNDSEEKLQKIRTDFDTKIQNKEILLKSALSGSNLKQTEVIKYSWSEPKGSKPAQLQKATSSDITVTFN